MSYKTESRPGTFMDIFSLQGADEDQTRIGKQLDQVNNYNTINNALSRTNSMETVWAYDMEMNVSRETSPRPTENNTGNFGIPSMLRTTHMETQYDPHQFGNTDKPTSFWSTVIHLIIISAGPAILSLPISFMKVGYAIGVVGILTSTYLYAYCMRILLWSEYEVCKLKRVPHLSYPDLIYFTFEDGPQNLRWFARFGRCIIDIVFIVLWSSACCYNLTLAAENINIVYNQWAHRSTDVHLTMSWIVIPLLILCWVPRLKYLVPISVVANIANALCIGVVIYDIIFSKEPFKGASAVGSITNLPFFLGTVFFTVTGTGLMLPLKAEMKEPGRFNSTFGILTVTYIPVFFMYALFSLLCTFKYGSSMKETVTQNVQQGHSLTQYMILANAIALMLQYPLLAYVIFDVIWNSLMKESKKIWAGSVVWEYLLRTAITMVIFLITYVLPSVELFLTFGGAVGTMIDSMLFPAFIQVVVMWKVSKNKRMFTRCLYKNVAISLLAIVLMVTGSISCFRDILEYYSGKKKTS